MMGFEMAQQAYWELKTNPIKRENDHPFIVIFKTKDNLFAIDCIPEPNGPLIPETSRINRPCISNYNFLEGTPHQSIKTRFYQYKGDHMHGFPVFQEVF
jgi:hypothetical protein